MEPALKQEVRKEISRIVDLMIQAESIRESIAELKKDIKTEYGLEVTFEVPPYQIARWVVSEDKMALDQFIAKSISNSGVDVDDDPVFLAKSYWDVNYAEEKNPKIRFLTSKERI